MSALLMGRVFYTDLPSHLKFTLLALADHANDEGGGIFVGKQRLARKVGLSIRSVYDNLRALRDAGYLTHEGRTGPQGTARYRIEVAMLPEVDRQSTADRQKLPIGSPPHVAASRSAVDRTVDRQPTASKPSVTVRKKKQPEETARTTRLPDLFPLTDDLRNYAVGKGCRDPARTHEAFVTHYRGSGKAQLNWRATFQTWVLGAHGGPAWKACGCAPLRVVGRPSAVDVAREVVADWVAEGKIAR